MQPLVITLTGDCSHQQVGRYWRQYRPAFAQASAVDVHFKDLTAIDSALVALLVDWAARAHQRQVPLRLINLPHQLHQLIKVNAADDLLPHCSGNEYAKSNH